MWRYKDWYTLTYLYCGKKPYQRWKTENNSRTVLLVLTSGIQNELLGLSALNIFLSVTAFLGNTLILVALHKESSLHPPSKLLYRSLAATDLCVGIIAEPLSVTYLMSVVNEQWNICRFVHSNYITGYILCSMSLLTTTVISVERLLALLLGLGYRQVVTLKRTYLIVIKPLLIISITR